MAVAVAVAEAVVTVAPRGGWREGRQERLQRRGREEAAEGGEAGRWRTGREGVRRTGARREWGMREER